MKKSKLFSGLILAAMLLFSKSTLAQQENPVLSRDVKRQIIETIAKKINEIYVFPDTALKMGMFIRKQFEKGAYDTIQHAEVFARHLTDDIWSVYHDGQFSIRYSPELAGSKPENNGDMFKRRQEFGRRINYGFEKAEILDGNIGYIKLNGFWGIEKESEQTVRSALRFVSHSKALIFDLRDNRGGQPDMVSYIIGFLFKDKVHLNDLYERESNHLEAFWTKPDTSFGTLDMPVYVLISKSTFSAGEEFTYDLQTQNRAVIVGEVSGGGAHPVGPNLVGYGFVVNIPFARAINPITKTNWEAVGVKPDISVGSDKALDTVLDKIKKTF